MRHASVLVQALVEVGCERRLLSDAFRVRSPLRAADVRWVRVQAKCSRVPSLSNCLRHATGHALASDCAIAPSLTILL